MGKPGTLAFGITAGIYSIIGFFLWYTFQSQQQSSQLAPVAVTTAMFIAQPESKPEPKPEPKPESKPEPKLESKSEPQSIKTPTTKQPVVKKERHRPNPHSMAEQINAEAIYTNQLSRYLATLAQKNYPKRAKRRHQQGEVTIQFTLHPDGHISNLSIVKRTYYESLNEATLNIIRHTMAYQYKPFPKEMRQSPKTIQVPIEYILR